MGKQLEKWTDTEARTGLQTLSDLIEHGEETGDEYLVLLAVGMTAGAGDAARLDFAVLARHAHLSEARVSEVLHRLERRGRVRVNLADSLVHVLFGEVRA